MGGMPRASLMWALSFLTGTSLRGMSSSMPSAFLRVMRPVSRTLRWVSGSGRREICASLEIWRSRAAG
ncbi:hypothetical protein D3C87_1613760 [compost metagenome]